MSEDKERQIIKPRYGFFSDVAMRIKLVLRLLADPRVNILVKLIPIGSAVYLLFPDLAPGPIDDVALIWLGTYVFVELCPPEVVKEHLDVLTQVLPGEWQDAIEPDNEAIEAEYWEKKEE